MVNKHWPPTTKEDKELCRMLNVLSPEDFRKVLREGTNFIVRSLSERSKTPEELMQWRDKMLAPSRFPHLDPPVYIAALKKNFHEALLEKRKSPFKAIKGGRRQKRIKQNLKGEFNP